MKLKIVLTKITAIVAVIFIVGSCDDDFNSVGSEVIGDVNFEENLYIASPIAYSKQFESVQTNGLVNNLLGVYNDPFYGQTTYSVVSQIQPGSSNPRLGDNPVLTSVVLSLPYFSRAVNSETNENNEIVTTYELDSIYGTDPVKLSIYRSNYFLRDFDGEERQTYYSDDIVENFGPALEDSLLFSIDSFVPSNREIITFTEDDDSDEDEEAQRVRIAPQLRIEIRAEDMGIGTSMDGDYLGDVSKKEEEIINYLQEVLINRVEDIEFSNADNFRNFFRGLYFKTEAINGSGNLVFFDIANARFTLNYTFQRDATTQEIDDGMTSPVSDQGELEFTFSNNIVNSIDFDFDDTTENILNNQDTTNGEDDLYLKGGEGSYAVIDLFSKCVETDANGDFVVDADGNPVFVNCTGTSTDQTELDFLRSRDWLVNDATLKFYINKNKLGTGGDTEPERVYIFNTETGGILVDYLADLTQDQINPIRSITNHLGRITRDADDNGDFYTIRLTQHIINILNEDIENDQLGLSVSQNVNIVANAIGRTPTSPEDDEIIPFSSIISHEGTILYGNTDGVPDEKRLHLNISFTKSKNN